MPKSEELLNRITEPFPMFALETDQNGNQWRWLNGPNSLLFLPRDQTLYSYVVFKFARIFGSAIRFSVDGLVEKEVLSDNAEEVWLAIGRGDNAAKVNIDVLDFIPSPPQSTDQRMLSASVTGITLVQLEKPAPLPPGRVLCSVPWNHLFVTEDGRFAACCEAADGPSPHFKNEDGSDIRFIDEASLSQAWNSVTMKEIRRLSFSGEFPAQCSKCEVCEKSKMPSYRTFLTNKFPVNPLQVLTSAQEDFSMPAEQWPFVDLRLGNVCNLLCRMCTPQYSVGLLREFDILNPAISAEVRSRKGHYEWFRSPEIWKSLGPHLKHIEELLIAGGEPFADNALRSVMTELISRGAAANIKIIISSNLTNLPEWIFEAFPLFKAVEIRVSMDGIGALQEYIRYPSKYPVVLSNLKKLDGNFRALNLTRVLVHMTVQSLNVWQVPDLSRLINTSFENIDPFLFLGMVHDRQSQFSVACLPRALKMKIAERLEFGKPSRSFLPRADYDGMKFYLERLDAIIRYMLDGDGEDLLPQLRESITKVDSLRSESFHIVAPEMARGIF